MASPSTKVYTHIYLIIYYNYPKLATNEKTSPQSKNSLAAYEHWPPEIKIIPLNKNLISVVTPYLMSYIISFTIYIYII